MPEGIEVKAAKDFLADAVDIDPMLALNAVSSIVERYRNPNMSINEFLAILEKRYEATEAVAMLRGT